VISVSGSVVPTRQAVKNQTTYTCQTISHELVGAPNRGVTHQRPVANIKCST